LKRYSFKLNGEMVISNKKPNKKLIKGLITSLVKKPIKISATTLTLINYDHFASFYRKSNYKVIIKHKFFKLMAPKFV